MSRQTGLSIWVLLLQALLLTACYEMQVSEPVAETQPDRVASVYLVTLTGQYPENQVAAQFSRYGISRIQAIGPQQYAVTLKQDPGLKALQEMAAASAMIRHIQPNYIYRKN